MPHSQINYMDIRAVVVGGSLGGLSSALALRCVNCDVDVFERSRGAMKSRGAGLVVQTELIDSQYGLGAYGLKTLIKQRNCQEWFTLA